MDEKDQCKNRRRGFRGCVILLFLETMVASGGGGGVADMAGLVLPSLGPA